MILAPLLAVFLAACGGPTVDCSDPSTVVAEAAGEQLTCAEASRVPDFIHVLAGRGPSAVERKRVVAWVGDRFRADPDATRAWLASIAASGRELEGLTGLEGARRRAHVVWEAEQGRGVIAPEHGVAYTVQDGALAVWASDDEAELALTEMDIEGWLHYASLCREVQGGGPLRLSVADRVQVYRMAQERFEGGTLADKVALVSFGPYWGQIKEGWQMASYERQQAWIAAAPLPPPMTATSLGYTDTILQSDLQRHATVLHERIGPFTMVKGRPAFD